VSKAALARGALLASIINAFEVRQTTIASANRQIVQT
jgi:hypothetical protein